MTQFAPIKVKKTAGPVQPSHFDKVNQVLFSQTDNNIYQLTPDNQILNYSDGFNKLKNHIVAGTNVTVTPNDTNKTITINATATSSGGSVGSQNTITITTNTTTDINGGYYAVKTDNNDVTLTINTNAGNDCTITIYLLSGVNKLYINLNGHIYNDGKKDYTGIQKFTDGFYKFAVIKKIDGKFRLQR